VAERQICPICNKRRAERFCPAKGEKICTVDCGTEREVTIDCPSDCAFLIAAHRWEKSEAKPTVPSEVAFPDVSFPADLIRLRREFLSGLGYAVLVYARSRPSLTDAELFDAARAAAEAYRTLISGIYYEKPPQNQIAAGLYAAIAKFIEDNKSAETQRPEVPPMKTTELFHLLVFFLRYGQMQSNGRPRTRGFIDFLRTQYPPEMGLVKEAPRVTLT
jgi:hypothetical protein